MPSNTSSNNNGNNESQSIVFENNALLPMLYGEKDATLKQLEDQLGVSVSSRGNMLAISGTAKAVDTARQVLEQLYGSLEQGRDISKGDVEAAMRMATDSSGKKAAGKVGISNLSIKTLKKDVRPYSNVQASYIKALYDRDMIFALGPAGTGKTYLAVAMAVHQFINGSVSRIVLSRPAVEAGEKLGFLPGDLKEKIDPYLRPLYDALFDMMPAEKVARHMENGEIEVAPLAFMRGRTLSNAYIILDEAQNSTATQMKMFLTRLGENSRMVITGDLSQMDLPRDVKSGLADATRKLQHIEGIDIVRFTDADVVRHRLAAKIVQAYEEWDRKKVQRMKPQPDED
jgi:phosphate starvation-inducible protein PhoH and related proteins